MSKMWLFYQEESSAGRILCQAGWNPEQNVGDYYMLAVFEEVSCKMCGNVSASVVLKS
jgi:hypothetical protein